MLKAVLFDLDGVITDTAKFHFLAWRDLGAELGVIVDEAFNEELKGVSRMDSLERILAFGGLADKYSTAEKEAFCTKKNDHYLELIQEMTPADILPGILPLLEELREAGLKAIVTSASKNAPGILELLQVKDYFDGIVDPASVAAGKPAPDIFLAGAALAGVKPAECIGVEDAASGRGGYQSCAYPCDRNRRRRSAGASRPRLGRHERLVACRPPRYVGEGDGQWLASLSANGAASARNKSCASI